MQKQMKKKVLFKLYILWLLDKYSEDSFEIEIDEKAGENKLK